MHNDAHEQIRVRFFTKAKQFTVSDAPFAVPAKLGRQGLSEVVNHLLGLSEDPVPFDFLAQGQLLRTSLRKFLIGQPNLSSENILLLEFLPAVLVDDELKSEQLTAWVGCVHVAQADRGVVLSATYDGQLRLHDSQNLTTVTSCAASDNSLPIRDLTAFSVGSSLSVATAAKDHSVRVFEVSNPRSASAKFVPTHTLRAHSNSVECVAAWSSSSRHIVLSGDWNGNVMGWNLMSAESDGAAKKKSRNSQGAVPSSAAEVVTPTFLIRAHAQAVSGVQVVSSSSDAFAFTCSWDHSMKKWDLERQDCIQTFTASKVFTSIHASDSSLLLSSHPDGRVRLWDPRQESEAACVLTLGSLQDEQRQWTAQARWHPSDQHLFACCDYAGVVRVWDIRATTPIGLVNSHEGKALCVDWAEGDGKGRVLSGGSDSCLKAFSVS